jgi:hypothetical protein
MQKENKDGGGRKVKGAEARTTLKEVRTIPMLIYKLEAFEKDLIK